MSISIGLKNLDKVFAEVKQWPKDIEKVIDNEFYDFGLNTQNDARANAPVDEGFLRQNIFFKRTPGEVSVTVDVDYAAYLEFGTKSFAAAYVSSLPQDWRDLAAQFKGATGNSASFVTLVHTIWEWVQRKGFAAAYSIKSHKRSNAKASIENEKQAAYFITLKILKKGIKPHPYLFPAYEKNKILLISNLKKQLKAT